MVGEVQHDVSQAGQVSEDEQQSPARRQVRIFCFSSSQPPPQVHNSYDHGRDEHQS